MSSQLREHQQRGARSSYFSRCMSPSCIPVQDSYSRISLSDVVRPNGSCRRWRHLFKKLVSDGNRAISGPKPLTFQYDVVSYSQNFDDGLPDDDLPRLPPLSRHPFHHCRVDQFIRYK